MDFRGTTLLSPRLRLAAFRPADAPEIFAEVTPELTRWMLFDPSPSFEAFTAIAATWEGKMAAGTDLFLVSRLRDTGEFVGMIGLHHIRAHEAEPGVWVKLPGHGQGYGREGVARLAEFVAAEMASIETLVYPVAEENAPSRRIAESLGGTLAEDQVSRQTDSPKYRTLTYRIPVMSHQQPIV